MRDVGVIGSAENNGMGYLDSLSQSSFFVWMRSSPSIWAYPTVLTLHTIGLALLVGFNTAVDLRILGVSRGMPLEPIAKFFRFVWIGFWINAVSGTLLLILDPNKLTTTLFLVKMALVGLGVVLIWLTERVVFRPVAPARGVARLLAVASLTVWTGAMTTGRLMAYFANR